MATLELTKLEITRTEVGNQINRLIEKVRELAKKLSSACTQEQFLEVQEAQAQWSQEVGSVLRVDFDNGSVALEFCNIGIGSIDDDHSLANNIDTLAVALERKFQWLEQLRDRLDEYPESELIPRGGPLER